MPTKSKTKILIEALKRGAKTVKNEVVNTAKNFLNNGGMRQTVEDNFRAKSPDYIKKQIDEFNAKKK
jgi:hypothetical protein